jgi:hypothetical protein
LHLLQKIAILCGHFLVHGSQQRLNSKKLLSTDDSSQNIARRNWAEIRMAGDPTSDADLVIVGFRGDAV